MTQINSLKLSFTCLATVWSKETLQNKEALTLVANVSGGLSVLVYLCQTTYRANKF